MPKVIHNPEESRFESREGDLVSVADYFMQGKTLVVTHVIVPPQLRGQGVASQLAEGVIAYVRQEELFLRPMCSFMVAYLKRHPEHEDLLV